MFSLFSFFTKTKHFASSEKLPYVKQANVEAAGYAVKVSKKSYTFIANNKRIQTVLVLEITEGAHKGEHLILFVDHRENNKKFRENVIEAFTGKGKLDKNDVLQPSSILEKEAVAIVERNGSGAIKIKRIIRG